MYQKKKTNHSGNQNVPRSSIAENYPKKKSRKREKQYFHLKRHDSVSKENTFSMNFLPGTGQQHREDPDNKQKNLCPKWCFHEMHGKNQKRFYKENCRMQFPEFFF